MDINTPPKIYSEIHYRSEQERRFISKYVFWLVVVALFLAAIGTGVGYFLLPKNNSSDNNQPAPPETDKPTRKGFVVDRYDVEKFYNYNVPSAANTDKFNAFLLEKYTPNAMLSTPMTGIEVGEYALNDKNLISEYLSSNYLLPVLDEFFLVLRENQNANLSVTTSVLNDSISLNFSINYKQIENSDSVKANDDVSLVYSYDFLNVSFARYAWISNYNLTESAFNGLKTLSASIAYDSLVSTSAVKVNDVEISNEKKMYPEKVDSRKNKYDWNENITIDGGLNIYIPLIKSTFSITDVSAVDVEDTLALKSGVSAEQFNESSWEEKLVKLEYSNLNFTSKISQYASALEAKTVARIKYNSTELGFASIDVTNDHSKFISYPANITYAQAMPSFETSYESLEADLAIKELQSLGYNTSNITFNTKQFKYVLKSSAGDNVYYLFNDGTNIETNSYVDYQFHPNILNINGTDNITVPIIQTAQEFIYEVNVANQSTWEYVVSNPLYVQNISLAVIDQTHIKLTFANFLTTTSTGDFTITLKNKLDALQTIKTVNVSIIGTHTISGTSKIFINNSNTNISFQYKIFGVTQGLTWGVVGVPAVYSSNFSIDSTGVFSFVASSFIAFNDHFSIRISYNNAYYKTVEIDMECNFGITGGAQNGIVNITSSTFATSNEFAYGSFVSNGSSTDTWSLINISKSLYASSVSLVNTSSTQYELRFNNTTGIYFTTDSFTLTIKCVNGTLSAEKNITVSINNSLVPTRADGSIYHIDNNDWIREPAKIEFSAISSRVTTDWKTPIYLLSFDDYVASEQQVPTQLRNYIAMNINTGKLEVTRSYLFDQFNLQGRYSFSVFFSLLNDGRRVYSAPLYVTLELNSLCVEISEGHEYAEITNDSFTPSFNADTTFRSNEPNSLWSIDSISLDGSVTHLYDNIFALLFSTATQTNKIQINSSSLVNQDYVLTLKVTIKCRSGKPLDTRYTLYVYTININCPKI